MNVNYTVSPVRKAVLVLLAPFIYTSSVLATENTVESTPDVGVTPYIVNGSNASVIEFPSIASLFIDRSGYDGVYSTDPYCGATILNPTHILTAAHCIYGDENAQLFTTVVPQLENTSEFPNGNIQKARVAEVYYRSDYSNSLSKLLPNDVAILKLETSLNIGANIIPPSSELYRSSSSQFVAVGHGDTATGQDKTNRLQKVDLTYVENNVCAGVFTDGVSLTQKQICFSGAQGASNLYGGTCQGDSGGPVYWWDGSAYQQVGITSFGPTVCGGSSSVTSVFTEIYDYRDWITDVANGVISSSETVRISATDAKRTAYVNARTSSGSGGSGGSVSFGLLGALMLLGGFRRAMSR
ncbi:trypsin-like serine protease [Vibrio splendidus]|uniref:S1 family peptidase n=1 Tax=Vibrio splendidus TaxID=29497 RepID=UPI000C83DDDF|nr:trypsin-like serine protease [Vibrio splendidus]PMO98994.1 serine protease [Vibrio splendidus]PMP29276.1 serine protease [Vibrio splendidus]PMP31883.1 serine protease [Vibrio splendidus]PMP41251.1 serine protease [Vibrio splendidus]PMP49705.1 serine protease [Vibrio splendidus]